MRQPFGQNFLIDPTIASRIVEAAEITREDTVLEVGPGHGILTGMLAERAGKLVAVEIDPRLANELATKYAGADNVTVVRRNFMEYDLAELGPSFKLVANLPYYLATAILERVLPLPIWRMGVIMVQKEVGERICAEPGGREYGYYSVFCQYYAAPELYIKVDPGAFRPPPKVDSAVLRLKNRMPPQPDAALFPIVKLAFQHRRKTMLNALVRGLQLPKEVVGKALETARIDPVRRPETLSLEEFSALTNILKKDIIIDAQIENNDKR